MLRSFIAWLKRRKVVVLLLVFSFIVSGLLINALELTTVPLYFINKKWFRIINSKIVYLHWSGEFLNQLREAGRHTDRQTDTDTDRRTDRQSRERERERDRQTGREGTDRQSRQTDRQTDGWTDRHTHRQTKQRGNRLTDRQTDRRTRKADRDRWMEGQIDRQTHAGRYIFLILFSSHRTFPMQ